MISVNAGSSIINQCTILFGMLINEGVTARAGACGMWEISAQFCYESKTILKN